MFVVIFVARFDSGQTCFSGGGTGELLPVLVPAPGTALAFRPSLEITDIPEPRNENYNTTASYC